MLFANPAAVEGGGSRRLSGIEAARGIAAVLVIFYHAVRHLDQATSVPALKAMLQFGHSGVDFFFVISGFIIFFVHGRDAGRPGRAGHYATRRLTRLMPTYWVALAVTLALSLVAGHGIPSAEAMIWSATLLPSDHAPLLGVAWTLKHEVLFYLLFLVLIVSRMAGLVLLACWFLAIIIATLAGRTDGVLPSMMFSIYNLEFLFGMAAAALVRSGRLRAPRLILTAGLAGLGLACGAENAGLMNGYDDLARLAYGIPSALIVMGLAEADQRNLLRVPAVLRSLGVASYSLYLFQFVFIGLAWQVLRFTRLDQSLPATLQLLLLALGAVAGGMVMACGVERPLIGLLRRGLGVRRPRLILG
jgi:peptidoglycan/LPS O-acetylase OafA/YrhL